jgi:NAD(P)-dependent dehydrogenase (short-subunit alcohol dehydrogenase family)
MILGNFFLGSTTIFQYSIHNRKFKLQMILPYSVSKTALLGLTKALSFELGQENIRVNCVCPGIIETKFASAVSSFLQVSIFFINFSSSFHFNLAYRKRLHCRKD